MVSNKLCVGIKGWLLNRKCVKLNLFISIQIPPPLIFFDFIIFEKSTFLNSSKLLGLHNVEFRDLQNSCATLIFTVSFEYDIMFLSSRHTASPWLPLSLLVENKYFFNRFQASISYLLMKQALKTLLRRVIIVKVESIKYQRINWFHIITIPPHFHQVKMVTVMLVTSGCWWLKVGDFKVGNDL